MADNATAGLAGTSQNLFMRLLVWREKHISEKNFVVFLALLVGTLGGFAALLLKELIHLISHGLTSGMSATSGNILFIIYPAVGVLITLLFVRYLVRDNISHGVTRVLYASSATTCSRRSAPVR